MILCTIAGRFNFNVRNCGGLLVLEDHREAWLSGQFSRILLSKKKCRTIRIQRKILLINIIIIKFGMNRQYTVYGYFYTIASKFLNGPSHHHLRLVEIYFRYLHCQRAYAYFKNLFVLLSGSRKLEPVRPFLSRYQSPVTYKTRLFSASFDYC